MFLYHYSKEKYPELLTAELQGTVTPEKRERADQLKDKYSLTGPYYDHVSFLLEPAPVDILGAIYPADHHTWAAGTELWEHIVRVDHLDLYGWDVVESNVDMFFADYVPWFDNDAYRTAMTRIMMTAAKISGNQGNDLKSLQRRLRNHPAGETRKQYLKAAQHKNFEYNMYKYAAGVPHLMAYTRKPIRVTAHRKVKVSTEPFPSVEGWMGW